MNTHPHCKLLALLPAIALAFSASVAHADDRCGADHWRSGPAYGGRAFIYRSGPVSDAPIREGFRNGELTRSEARRLEEERASLNYEYRRDARDGYISPREQRELRENTREYQRDLDHELRDREYRR